MASFTWDLFDFDFDSEELPTLSVTTHEFHVLPPIIDYESTESLTLEASEDMSGGMIIDSIRLPDDISLFRQSLRHSLTQWKAQEKCVVWLKLTREQSAFIDPAIQEGFHFHSTQPTSGMLVIWLAADVPSAIPANAPTIPANASTKPVNAPAIPVNAPMHPVYPPTIFANASTIPPKASHQFGVGAFVLNYDGEVLAVQEKSGVFGGGNIWKLPTGSLYQGEDISARVVRVVKELTGIDTKFEQVVAFRRSNEVPYYQTNTFYMCTLGPLSTITVQDTDSMAVKWMPLGEFESQEYLKEKEMLRRMLDGCIKSTKEAQYTGYRMEDIHAGTGQEPAIFYHNGF